MLGETLGIGELLLILLIVIVVLEERNLKS